MSKPNITIPTSFGGVKADFDNNHLTNGFPQLTPDVLPGDCLNKFIDDTYKGLNGVLELYKGVVLYDVTETYSNTSIVFYIDTNDNNKIKLYRSLQNSNTGNSLSDDTYWKEVQFGGAWGSITGTLSNQADLNTALNGKVSKSACATVYPVIQKYQNGTSWYRIYSDGWCEMGGQTTTRDEEVTFLKTFADTTYNVVGNEIVNSTVSEYELLIFKLSTNKIRIYCDYSGSYGGLGACWRASGKLATGQY